MMNVASKGGCVEEIMILSEDQRHNLGLKELRHDILSHI